MTNIEKIQELNTIEFVYSADDKDFDNMLFDIISSAGAEIDHILWKSQYNNYIVYDYEPFCTGGMNKVVTLKRTPVNLFAEYLVNKRLETIEQLAKAYMLQ